MKVGYIAGYDIVSEIRGHLMFLETAKCKSVHLLWATLLISILLLLKHENLQRTKVVKKSCMFWRYWIFYSAM